MSRSVKLDTETLRERQARIQEPATQTGFGTLYETLDTYQQEDHR
jgi:hypothetical protein